MFDPIPGKEAKVTVENYIQPGHLAFSPKTSTYVGKIENPARWLAPDEFQMHAGSDTRIGFRSRVISKSSIIALEYLDGSEAVDVEKPKILPDFNETVTGSKGNQYLVKHKAGKWSCTCTGFGFRGRCKHVKGIQEKYV